MEGQIHYMCHEYGWTIEYVMNLTRRQVRRLFDGNAQLNRSSEQTSTNDIQSVMREPFDLSKPRVNYVSGNDASALLGMFSSPGVKVSDKVKKDLSNKLKSKK